MPQHLSPRVEILEDRIAPATFTVTNLNDAGAGSLRDAVAQADAHTGIDTIVFKAGVTGNIVLTTGEITTTGNLIIKGPGGPGITIDGNLNGRILDIKDGSSTTDSPVSISNIAFIDGNVANTVAGNGGAIFSTESLTLTNCVVSNNRADIGAGVAVMGGTGSSVKIVNSIFTGNDNSNNSSGNTNQGGAVFAGVQDTITVTGSQFLHNSSDYGAGIYGVSLGTGKTSGITISSSTFADNVGREGAGVFLQNQSTSAKSPAKITGCTFNGNTASVSGAGLILEAGHWSISGTNIQENSGAKAGGLYAWGFDGLSIVKSNVSGNKATANSGYGGGIYLYHDNQGVPTVTISGSTIADNSAPQGSGGGIYQKSDNNLAISTTAIVGNTCSGNGAGAYLQGVLDTIAGGQVSNNIAGNDGGGVFFDSTGTLKAASTRFTSNIANTAGGALFTSGTISVQISKTVLSGNEGHNEGGAIFEGGGFMTLTNDIFTGNDTNSLGGAIYISTGTGGATLTKTIVEANISNDFTGGIYKVAASSGTVTLGAGTVVSGNIAELAPNTFGF